MCSSGGLQDSLTGNSCTHLLACLHPQPANLRECHATLQFAIRCTNIHTAPVVNTVVPPGADAEQAAMIARLNGELQRLQQVTTCMAVALVSLLHVTTCMHPQSRAIKTWRRPGPTFADLPQPSHASAEQNVTMG